VPAQRVRLLRLVEAVECSQGAAEPDARMLVQGDTAGLVDDLHRPACVPDRVVEPAVSTRHQAARGVAN
jgi:hypothetical protein